MGNTNETRAEQENRDPISGAPGAHPVGTGIGAAVGGAAAGAATASVAGPVGTAVGAAVGAVVGGLAGKGAAEAVDPTREDAYWRDNYLSRPYVEQGLAYDEYAPAYAYGVDAYTRYPGKSFDDVEGDLSSGWDSARRQSHLSWERAKGATRDAWARLSS